MLLNMILVGQPPPTAPEFEPTLGFWILIGFWLAIMSVQTYRWWRKRHAKIAKSPKLPKRVPPKFSD